MKTCPLITRYPENPILTCKDVPGDAGLIFNAGVTKFNGSYVMVFRNDYDAIEADFQKEPRGKTFKTKLGLAFSADGIHWSVDPNKNILGEMLDNEIIRVYDPRLTVLNGQAYLCFAADTKHGLRGGIAVTDNFETFEVLSLSAPDNRNMALFPQLFNDKFVRLERPFPVYSRGGVDRFDMWISDSPDCVYWGNSQLLLSVEDVPFSNDKVGPGAPPVKTSSGWLTLFHAVDIERGRGKNGWENKWQKRYSAGIMLLDLENPYKIKGLSKLPLLAPEADYEISGGFRNNVIFPGGMILEPDGEVKIYYGAADTVECLATADVGDLIKLCQE